MMKRLIAFVLLLTATCSFGIGNFKSDEVFARNFGAPSYETLTNVLAKIGTAEKTLVIDGGEWVVGTNSVLVRSNVTIRMAEDSWFGVDDTDTDAQPGIRGLLYARPEWFGAKANDDVCDTRAIRAAILASEFVEFGPGEYITKRRLIIRTPDHDVVIKGAGRDVTTIRNALEEGYNSDWYDLWVGATAPNLLSYVLFTAPKVADEAAAITTTVTLDGITFDGGFTEMRAQMTGSTPKWQNVSTGCIRLGGSGHTLRNCRLTNYGGAPYGLECFITVFDPYTVQNTKDVVVENNIFENPVSVESYLAANQNFVLISQSVAASDAVSVACKAAHPTATDNATFCATEAPFAMHVRNNLVQHSGCVTASGVKWQNWATFSQLLKGDLVNNTLLDSPGLTIVQQDTGVIKDVVYKDNVGLGLQGGFIFGQSDYGGVWRNIVIEDNFITFEGAIPASEHVYALYMDSGAWATRGYMSSNYLADFLPTFSNIVVRGNTFIKDAEYGTNAIQGINIRAMHLTMATGDGANPSIYQTNVQYRGVVLSDNILEDNSSPFVFAGFTAPTSVSYYADIDPYVLNGEWVTTDNNRGRSGTRYFMLDGYNAYNYWTNRDYSLRGELVRATQVTATSATIGNASISSLDTDTASIDSLNGASLRVLTAPGSILPYDGSMGGTNSSLTWMVSVEPGNTATRAADYTLSSDEYFEGRRSAQIVVTNNTAGDAAAIRFKFPSIGASGEWYTAGAFIKTHSTGVVARNDFYFENAFVTGTYAQTAQIIPTNQWTHLQYSFQLPSTTTEFDYRFTLLTDSNNVPYTPLNSTAFVDNVYITKGVLGTNRYVTVPELTYVEDPTKYRPLRVSEVVYDYVTGKWYKAHGLTTNEWDALN